MPLSKLHAPQSLSDVMCKDIGELLHDSLVETCAVNPADNFCLISRYSEAEMIVHPTFLGERDPKATITVEIVLLGGRTDAQKEALYQDFRERLKSIGFNPNNAIIFLVENGPIDWSFSAQGSVKTQLGL